ncbi:Uncharacterized protein APZ42_005649 [Daphnia magna]|uniref:Uncharacterized protein n=1 Tax=Daphnia magna TaxID=35525 RepID=A0A162BXU5_9CRUS|nr:Uncharacterized protein APZ42_005649 [Daphnia magna]
MASAFDHVEHWSFHMLLLEYFIGNHGLEDEMGDEDPNYLGDVSFGDMYRKLRREKMIDGNTQINSATKLGCQYAFWPFLTIINEAPFKIRREFVVLLSLWYGNKKPPAKAIMDQPLTELRKLEEQGIIVNVRKYRLVILIVTTDMLARPIP